MPVVLLVASAGALAVGAGGLLVARVKAWMAQRRLRQQQGA
jgi:hypothetical protein